MTKKIYFETGWWNRIGESSMFRSIVDNPPEGYEFIFQPRPVQDSLFTAASKSRIPGLVLNYVIDKVIPVNLALACWVSLRRIPSDADLIFTGLITFRKKPWIVNLEHVTFLASANPTHFKLFKKTIKRALASPYCRKVLCHTELAKRGVLLNLDCSGWEQKVDVLPRTVARKDFSKSFNRDRVKILFVDSALTPYFEIKGGREALEVFALLSKKYDNLEFVMRSNVPPGEREKYLSYNNIKIIDEVLPWQKLEQEFKSADIFFLPAHSTPFLTFLDAMSYELPVVTIDALSNAEVIEDGKTGFVVKKSEKVPYLSENLIPDFSSRRFREAVKTTDPRVLQDLVDKVGLLIENEELRRTMGKQGRWEIEHGKFSIERRTEKLKRIFDEATA